MSPDLPPRLPARPAQRLPAAPAQRLPAPPAQRPPAPALLTAALALLLALPAAAEDAAVQSTLVNAAAITFERDGQFEEGNISRSSQTYTVNIRDCRTLVRDNPVLTLDWEFNDSFEAGDGDYAIKLFRGEENCLRTSLDEDTGESICTLRVERTALQNAVVSRRLRHEIRARTLLGKDDPEDCTGSPRAVEAILIFEQFGVAGAADVQSDRIRLRWDLTRPTPPSSLEAAPGENSIRLNWEGGEDDEDREFTVFYDTTAFAIDQFPDEIDGPRTRTTSGTSLTISEGIELGNRYWIAVASRDNARNYSAFSEQIEVETVPVIDFWQAYRDAGGQESGGYCSHAAPGSAWPALLAMGALLAGLRRREHPEVTRD